MSEENNEIQDIGHDLSKNIEVVNYIMLHRIYDVLILLAKQIVGTEEIDKMVKYHDKGYLLGPEPSFTPSEENEEK